MSAQNPTFCDPFLRALPVSSVAISTLKSPFETETVCASDSVAARLDELQIDLGEGPCWTALRSGAPVLVQDVQHTPHAAWPVLHTAITEYGLHSVFAFPLIVGTLRIGAVDLYRQTPGPFTSAHATRAQALADVAALLVLHRAMDRLPAEEDDPSSSDNPYSRRDIPQATGMVIEQAKVSADDALLLIRARAFAENQSVRQIAARLIAREITLSR